MILQAKLLPICVIFWQQYTPLIKYRCNIHKKTWNYESLKKNNLTIEEIPANQGFFLYKYLNFDVLLFISRAFLTLSDVFYHYLSVVIYRSGIKQPSYTISKKPDIIISFYRSKAQILESGAICQKWLPKYRICYYQTPKGN